VAEGSLRKAPLTSRVERVGPFIDNQQMIARKAEDDLKWQDFLRDEIKRLLTAFYWLNGGVVFLVLLLWLGQIKLSPATAAPIITEKVVLGLIAASAAQLGALAFGAAMAAVKRGSK
jgi:hypothetical protein